MHVNSPNMLVFVSYRRSETREEEIEGSPPTWDINIYLTESAKGRFGHTLMSSNTNC